VVIGGKAEGLLRLRELGLPVPPFVSVPVGEQLAGVPDELGELLAVRSSAVGEDAADRSAAGQFESAMGVTAATLAEAVARVRAGSERAVAYGAGSEIAVVVQHEVRAGRAGVAFSRDPVTGADEVVVECVFGHGERLVGGEADPDRYRVLRDGRVVARAAGGLRTLRADEARAVAELARRAEDGFGRPVDVEFCFEGRRLWLVQCRPITTL